MTTEQSPFPTSHDEHEALRQLIGQVPNVALALYDATTATLLLCNPRYAAAQGTGALPEALRGQPWQATAWWATPAQAAEQWQAALSSGMPLHQPELAVPLTDGRSSCWDWSITPIADQRQPTQVRYLLVMAADISAAVRSRQHAEQLDQLKDEFLLLASHELRTPLTSVVGYMHLLANLLAQHPSGQAEQDARVTRYVTTIKQQLDRLTRLVDDLADLGRLQSGKFTLRRETVDLTQVLRRVAEEALMLTSRHKLLLSLPQPEAALLIEADHERLIQVLMNLVQNAVSYAPLSDRIELRLQQDASHAQIEVQDYGPGIAPHDLAELFDRFFQVARKQRSAHGGLGLGLFICKQIIEQHGGTIAVDSTLGQGTTFRIRLPLASA